MKLLIVSSDLARVRVIADSALGRNHQPWFLPDVGANWRAWLAPAVRISRLGKGIKPQFAARYALEHTLLWVPEADECPDANFMDGAVVVGDWLPTEELEAPWPEALARVSRLATLKTGDIVALEPPEAPRSPLVAPSTIRAAIGSNPVIDFNIR